MVDVVWIILLFWSYYKVWSPMIVEGRLCGGVLVLIGLIGLICVCRGGVRCVVS